MLPLQDEERDVDLALNQQVATCAEAPPGISVDSAS